jgi:cyclophilin family peptidyl-prolyl cis-trans isomerase
MTWRVAGRPRTSVPTVLPRAMAGLLQGPAASMAAATVIGRFHLPLVPLTPLEVWSHLAGGRFGEQLIGARLMGAASIGMPPPVVVSSLHPTVVAAYAHSLEARHDLPAGEWVGLIDLVRERYVLNPRAWANAWRGVRDAAPKADVEVMRALRASTEVVDAVRLEPASVAAALRCENARTLDQPTGVPARVLTCADGAERWRSLVVAAEVWGSSEVEPARRAIALQGVLEEAGGDVRVMEAVATAAVRLPVGAARPLVRRLSEQRDPGVLAALLEGLELHVQHARALDPAIQRALVQAPFSLPEPPSIEARLHAISLASLLRLPLPDASVRARALMQARQPDASVLPSVVAPVAAGSAGNLVLETTAGRIVLDLQADTAPEAVRFVIRSAQEHRYDGTSFHRVVPAFVAQGGDPRGDGYGGTTETIPTEVSSRRFSRGAVGIALAGLDTGGMQFFIVTADAPSLDGRYPWIGTVVQGDDLIDRILVGDQIQTARFQPVVRGADPPADPSDRPSRAPR